MVRHEKEHRQFLVGFEYLVELLVGVFIIVEHHYGSGGGDCESTVIKIGNFNHDSWGIKFTLLVTPGADDGFIFGSAAGGRPQTPDIFRFHRATPRGDRTVRLHGRHPLGPRVTACIRRGSCREPHGRQ